MPLTESEGDLLKQHFFENESTEKQKQPEEMQTETERLKRVFDSAIQKHTQIETEEAEVEEKLDHELKELLSEDEKQADELDLSEEDKEEITAIAQELEQLKTKLAELGLDLEKIGPELTEILLAKVRLDNAEKDEKGEEPDKDEEYEMEMMDDGGDDEEEDYKDLKAKAAKNRKNNATTAKQKQTEADAGETEETTEKLKQQLETFLKQGINFAKDDSVIDVIRPLLKNEETREPTIDHVTQQLNTQHKPKQWASGIKENTGVSGKAGGALTAGEIAYKIQKIGDEISGSAKPDSPTALSEAKPFYEAAVSSMLGALKNCDTKPPEKGYDLNTYLTERIKPLFLIHKKSGGDNIIRQKIIEELKNIAARAGVDEKNAGSMRMGSFEGNFDDLKAVA